MPFTPLNRLLETLFVICILRDWLEYRLSAVKNKLQTTLVKCELKTCKNFARFLIHLEDDIIYIFETEI